MKFIHGVVCISVIVKFLSIHISIINVSTDFGKIRLNTYDEAVTIFNEDITKSTIAIEKSFKVSFPDAVWKSTDVDPGPYHAIKNQVQSILISEQSRLVRLSRAKTVEDQSRMEN